MTGWHMTISEHIPPISRGEIVLTEAITDDRVDRPLLVYFDDAKAHDTETGFIEISTSVDGGKRLPRLRESHPAPWNFQRLRSHPSPAPPATAWTRATC